LRLSMSALLLVWQIRHWSAAVRNVAQAVV
jgi:hypothetical protein